MLSFSNFGSVRHPLADKVRRAVEIVQQRAPDLMVDGEMQADTAVAPRIFERDLSVQFAEGRRKRTDISESRSREHCLQAARAVRRRGGHRPHPDGSFETGACAAARRRSQRHRQCDGHRGGGCAGSRAAAIRIASESRRLTARLWLRFGHAVPAAAIPAGNSGNR